MSNADHIGAIKETGLNPRYKFAVCTLVTDVDEYREMLASFKDAGFTENLCEFRYIDNSSENSYDAYKGINLFLQNAQAEFIIICHQDILINIDKITQLEKCIEGISALDPDWAILSNAGGLENNLYRRLVLNLAYPGGRGSFSTDLPKKVGTVDENFILVKKSANLALSHNLRGFHLYGTDICLIAELLGYTAYVIDFKLTHKSLGNADEKYYQILQELIAKYRHFMRSRRILTTIADFYLSASKLTQSIKEGKYVKKWDRYQAKKATPKYDRFKRPNY